MDPQELTDLDGLVNVIIHLSYDFQIDTGQARAAALEDAQLC